MAGVEGKSVILTGGAGDIAQVVAARLLEAGARVLLVDRDKERLDVVAASFGSDQVQVFAGDVTSEEDTQSYVQAALSHFDGVDVLLANAGIEGVVAPMGEYPLDDFERVMAVNVTGPFLGIKHVFPLMAENGGGSIVITSSIAGMEGTSAMPAYCTSKHAVIGLMRNCAKEGGPLNIRVNTVNPAPVEGRMIESLERGNAPDNPEVAREAIRASIPIGR